MAVDGKKNPDNETLRDYIIGISSGLISAGLVELFRAIVHALSK